MSAVVTKINISNIAPQLKPITDTIVVGKDILDLLAGSMYSDPLTIYREYVQNAADAIDEARDMQLPFLQRPDVEIIFDQVERVVKIRDQGIGIPAHEFIQRLTTVGASQKRGKKLRGFRGVGRLAALGYCQELIFRGRAEGESRVSEIRWDGRMLREKMRDQNFSGGLAEIIQAAVTVKTTSADGFPSRFFEVELRKVSRLRNDLLLNEEIVRNYLSQVAPVPFSNEFKFRQEIQSHLEAHGIRAPIHIEINDGKGQVFHRARNEIFLRDTISTPVNSIEFVKYCGSDGEICAIGWIGDHAYAGSIPKRHGLGGIRLRAGNIQIGDESILAEIFPEARFSGWAMGDIHVISAKILPNGRRDEFEPSAHYSHFQTELTIQAKNITQLIRERSAQRNRLRSVGLQLSAAHGWIKSTFDKSLSPMLTQVLLEISEQELLQAVKEASKFELDSEDYKVSTKRVEELRKELTKSQLRLTNSAPRIGVKGNVGKKSVAIILKTILSNAKTPRDGIELSIEVLRAIEAT